MISFDGHNLEDLFFVGEPEYDILPSETEFEDVPGRDGSVPKGHLESMLRAFFPMFNFDCFLGNIIPETIGLDDGEISFQCSDDFDCAILCGAYAVIDGEDLSFSDWHNF